MTWTTTILSILLLLVSHSSFSQYFQSTNYKEGSGLPSSETYMVYQDSRGFIWIGTDNGVVKYDGREFVTYNSTQGLTDNTVFGFYEDHKGRIWFRTYNGALSYYDNDTIRSYQYNEPLKAFIGSSMIQTMKYDSAGALSFATLNFAMAAKIDASGKISPTYGDSMDADSVPKYTNEKGENWYFVGYAVDKMIAAPWRLGRELSKIQIDGEEFPISLDDQLNQNNWIIASAKWKGKYYFSMHKNIFTYDGKKVEKVFTADHNLISMYVDQKDHLWVGYFNNGVQMFTDESLKDPFSLVTLAGLSVSSVTQDYEGGIWLSTLDQGVFYYPNLTILNYDPPNNTRVSSVAHGDNEVFLGNYSGEVFRMDVNGATSFVSKGVAPVNYLFVDSEKKLWISDGSGTRIHQSGSFINGSGTKARVFKGLVQEKDFVIGCSSLGTLKMSLNGEVLRTVVRRGRPIALAITNNELYIGGLNGLEKEPLDFSAAPQKIVDGRISSLLALDDRYTAIGTISGGLVIYDVEKQKLFPYPIADVVNVYSMISDWPMRKMWIGTDKGLFQLDFTMGTEDLVLERLSKADGLISNKINKLFRMGRNVWAVSDLGISAIPMEHFGIPNFVPKFYIRRIMFKNQSVNVNSSVVRTDEANMVIEVRPISFRNYPTVFRYRLNDDQPWKMVSGGSIFLTDVKPNQYNLEIQAYSNGYDWTEGLNLKLEVMAKWWETGIFRLSAIVAIVVLAYITYWLRLRAIRRRQNYLELINLHQQKLIDSEIRTQERERKRIATDLHDGIGATLSSIKLQIADALHHNGDTGSTRATEINENLSFAIDDIKRIVYDLHPPGLERYGLRAALKSLVDRLNKAGDLEVIFNYYGQREIVQPVAITVFRILQELINNTLKHAQASEIRIQINEFDNEINIMYEDNGTGMAGNSMNGLGLHSIESRVRSLDARMSCESNHKGTFYNFDIPF